MNELRQNLGQSLFTVSTSPGARLDPGLLERESSRLSAAVDNFANRSNNGDYGSYLRPPSRSSLRGSASVESLHRPTASSTPAHVNSGRRYASDSTRRTLSFDRDA